MNRKFSGKEAAICIFAVSPGWISMRNIRIGCSRILSYVWNDVEDPIPVRWALYWSIALMELEMCIWWIFQLIVRIEPQNQLGVWVNFLAKVWNAAYQ